MFTFNRFSVTTMALGTGLILGGCAASTDESVDAADPVTSPDGTPTAAEVASQQQAIEQTDDNEEAMPEDAALSDDENVSSTSQPIILGPGFGWGGGFVGAPFVGGVGWGAGIPWGGGLGWGGAGWGGAGWGGGFRRVGFAGSWGSSCGPWGCSVW